MSNNVNAAAASNTQEPTANGNANKAANNANKGTNALNTNAANKAAKNAANKAAANAALAAAAMPVEAEVKENDANAKLVNASANAQGGRRRTKKAKKSQKGGKISKGASKWNQFVMRTFKEMRKKNKTVKLMDAMKECSKQKKKGIKY